MKMLYAIAANLVMLVHFAFIAFAAFGGLGLFYQAPHSVSVAWFHLPILAYTALIGVYGWVCPLTPGEAQLRAKAGQVAHGEDFVEHYIMPALFPKFLFPDGYPKNAFTWLCVLVLALNLAIYGLALLP
jgi:hypothetical protein